MLMVHIFNPTTATKATQRYSKYATFQDKKSAKKILNPKEGRIRGNQNILGQME